MPQVIDYEHGISAIDSGYLRPMLDAIHLMVEEARRWGSHLPDARILDIYSNDVELNTQGLGFWLDSLQ